MTIQQIKERISIREVLSYYGLEVNKNGMVNCPFHSDRKASMRVYEETNTVYCFAGSCEVSYLDVIDFIMKMEKSSKRSAIMKAKELIGELPGLPDKKSKQEQLITASYPVSKEDYARTPDNPLAPIDFSPYRQALERSKSARAYCSVRGLDWERQEIGYRSRRSGDSWGRGCIIFPLRDAVGEVVSLYGRSTVGKGHYYQTDRSGLYPCYPCSATEVLILTESVIDAASLLLLGMKKLSSLCKLCKLCNVGRCSVLALYGTNGMTEEHLEAIKGLKYLKEVVFALDGDAAGDSGISGGMRKFSYANLNECSWSRLRVPRGEDLNSLLVGHADWRGLLTELFKNRELLEVQKVSAKDVAATPAMESIKAASSISSSTPRLESSHPHNLIYQGSLGRYYVKGGLRCGLKDLDSLKVTIVVSNEEGKKSRNKLDLYEDKQVEKLSRLVGEKLGLRPDLVELDLQGLTDELEVYREEQQVKQKEQRANSSSASQLFLPPEVRSLCVSFLKRSDLMNALDERLAGYGLVGEENNRRLGFCIASSYGMREPLHGLIQGSSGSGKTHLLSKLCGLIPPEHYLPITRATDNSFYNYGRYELRGKLISVEDKDSMSEEANLAFRELQSKGMVSSSTTGQDESGQNRSYVKLVYGPIASLSCTTRGELYLDDMNRCFLLAVDESVAQTDRILDYQKRLAAGLVDRSSHEGIQSFMQNCLRLLQPYEVVIPYAPQLSLPEEVKDKRRLNSLYLSLVKQITLLHQYQREQDAKGCLVSTKSDLGLANEILFDAIVLKVDELHGPLRSFYEKVKAYLSKLATDQKEQYTFRQREIRQALRLSKSGVTRFFRELMELEYLQIVGGSERTGYHYKVSYWDDNAALRHRIQKYLRDQIDQLK